ncbi:MAG: hypothetical protein IIC29_07315 [Chloroflexi bacterium]|nr:hypothetical protein [Chloroflexota bacterium]
MRLIRLPFIGAVVVIGMIATIACQSSERTSEELVSGRPPSPEFPIQVADAVGEGTLEMSEFRLVDHADRPLVIYFSFVG